MANSRNYTAKDVWREATRDIVGVAGDIEPINIERFNIINRAADQVISTFYGFVRNQYMTEQLLMVETGGDYWVGGVGNTIVLSAGSDSTNVVVTLTNAGMYAAMSTADINKYVVFRIGADVYIAKILGVAWGATSSVITLKNELHFPTSFPQTIDEFLVLPSVIQDDEIDLSLLRISASGGPQIATVLQTTIAKKCYAMSLDELMVFDTTAQRNASKIAYYIGDNKIRMKTSATGYGSLSLFYPRLPALVSADTDYVDVPDGLLMTMVISLTKKIAAERMNVKGAFNPAEMQAIVYDFMKQFEVNVKMEEVKAKVQELT